jgi:hypothetical protein
MSEMSVERLDALLRGDEPRTAAEARRAALLGELRAATLHAPPALRARVLATGAAQRRLSLPPRRLALVVVPAALAVALLAAVVHGIVGSSGSRPKPLSIVAEPAAPKRELAPQVQGSAAAPTTVGGSRLRHTDASLELQVAGTDGVSAATTRATRIAASLGGYAQFVHFSSSRDGGGQAQLDLRIPAQNVRKAVTQLEALGTVLSQSLSEQDLQRLFTAQTNRIAQLRRRIAALARAVSDPSLPEAQRVLLRLQLSEARRSLAQALNARKGTVTAAADARVSLLLTTKPKAAAVPHHRGRLGRMIHSAAGFLALEGIVALAALVVLAPLLVLGALAWWAARLRRRRDERRLLAA